MSGLVIGVDLCEQFAVFVYGGRLDDGTVVIRQTCKEWPCPGEKELRAGPGGPVVGLVECDCPCHTGQLTHELPARAGRTAVHPTDVLADG